MADYLFPAFQQALNSGTAVVNGQPVGNAATGTGYSAPTTSSSATTSGDFRNYTNNLGNNLNSIQNNSDVLGSFLQQWQKSNQDQADSAKSTLDSETKLYQDRQTALDQQRQSELSQINSDFEAQKATKLDQQTKDLQPYEDKLGRVAGATGGPDMALAQNLQLQEQKIKQSYSNEINLLYQQQQGHILTANKAYSDSDFALAEKESSLATDYQNQISQRQKDFSSLFLNLYSQQRQDQQFQLTQQKDQQTFNNDHGISGAFYQIPGSSQVYDSRTGQPLSYSQYQQMGGQGKAGAAFPDVQLMQPQMNSASGKEYQDYVNSGGKLSFNDYLTMDANRKASRTTNVINDDTKVFDLRVKQAPSQVSGLAAKGYGWGDIAKYFQNLGIDPGSKEIDDALHRQFQSQDEYKKWKATQ